MAAFQPHDGSPDERARFFGPQQVDQTVRQAIQFCWLGLPAERRNVDEVEKEVRRIVDRAINDLREDDRAFRPDAS
ncbi:MAG: hypothetical protein AAF842_11790 [Planctomycetota bacterium]